MTRTSSLPLSSQHTLPLLPLSSQQFEKAENKPAIIGYSAAAAFVFFTAEWLIHLPALDVLLGFPVQLVGLLLLPFLGLRYLVDGADVTKDVEAYVSSITKKLPGERMSAPAQGVGVLGVMSADRAEAPLESYQLRFCSRMEGHVQGIEDQHFVF